MLILLAVAMNAVKRKNTEVQKTQVASFGFFLCELRASVFYFLNG